MLRAEIDGDEVHWRKYLRQYRAEGGCLEVMQVAFYMAARSRFGNVEDLREVVKFVNSFNGQAPPEERLPARQAEAVLRSALGEAHLTVGLDGQLVGNITYTLFFALVDDLKLTSAGVDRLLLGAEQILMQVERSGTPLPFRADVTDAVVIGSDSMHWRMRRVDTNPADIESPT